MENPALETVSRVAVSTLKRRRPALSCAECRRRKVKCDRTNPCGPCWKTKSPTCTYSSEALCSVKDHVPSSSSIAFTSGNYNGPKKLNGDSVNRNLRSFTHDTFSDDIGGFSKRSFSTSHSASGGTGIDHVLAQRVERLEEILRSSDNINGRKVETETMITNPSNGPRGTMSKNRYFGHSHWMSAIAESQSFMCFETSHKYDGIVEMKNKESDAAISAALYSCKSMATAIKAVQYPQWTILGVTFQHSMPIRSVADELVGHYLRTHEAIHRILHIPSFRREYEQYWVNPQSTSTVSLMKILLVMSIGTCFYQGADFEAHKTQAIHWIYTAQSWLASPKEKSRLHTAAIQVECLLHLARSIYNIGADILWNHTGGVLRTAMSMGFHRDPKHLKRYTVLHGEVRRRLWATILEFNIQVCLDSGMPLMISMDDFDTEPPSNINDDEIDESMNTQPASHTANTFTQSSLQVALLDTFTARLEIANHVNKYQNEHSYEEVIRLDKQLSRKFKENHTFCAKAAQDSPAKFRPTTLHCKILDLKIQGYLLVLHRPFAMKARNDPRFYYSHKIYLDTAMGVHSVPSTIVVTPDSNGNEYMDDYTRFRLISGGFIKDIMIHSILIIYQEMIKPLEEDFPEFFQENKSTREPYLRILQAVTDLSLKRLEAGETAVKTHLMYSIAFAHINALKQGTSAEEAMIEAAKSSLSQAKDILRQRMLSMPTVVDGQFEDGVGGMSDLAGGEMDFSMQDWGTEFEPSGPWLFSGWPLDNLRGSTF